jgi:hypothetical protein
LNQTGWSNAIVNGTITIRFYSLDLVNNLNYTDIILRIDLISPVVSIEDPGSGPWKDIAPTYRLTIDDTNITQIYYTIEFEGKTLVTHSVGLNSVGVVSQEIWDDLPDGQLKLTFYVLDKVGNLGMDEIYIVKESTASSKTARDNNSSQDELLLFWLQGTIVGGISGTIGVLIGLLYARFKKDKQTEYRT